MFQSKPKHKSIGSLHSSAGIGNAEAVHGPSIPLPHLPSRVSEQMVSTTKTTTLFWKLALHICSLEEKKITCCAIIKQLRHDYIPFLSLYETWHATTDNQVCTWYKRWNFKKQLGQAQTQGAWMTKFKSTNWSNPWIKQTYVNHTLLSAVGVPLSLILQ